MRCESDKPLGDACDVSRVAAYDAIAIVRYGNSWSTVAVVSIVVISVFISLPPDTLAKLDACDGQPHLLPIHDHVMHRR